MNTKLEMKLELLRLAYSVCGATAIGSAESVVKTAEKMERYVLGLKSDKKKEKKSS